MKDWIGLSFIVLLIIGAVAGLATLGKPYEVSQEEFDKRAHEAGGLMSAGLTGLQKVLDPAENKAAAVREDLKEGYLDGEQESGDDNNKRSPDNADERPLRNGN